MNRIEMIKQATYKIQGSPEFVASMKKANAKFIRDCQKKIAKLQAKADAKADKELEALDENYNHIMTKTAREIAEIEVGDTYRETIKFDNEWN